MNETKRITVEDLGKTPRFYVPFLVESKCPRIYYSDFNYRNRVGIKGVRKGDAFFRGWILQQEKSAVIFLQHLTYPKVIFQVSIVPTLLQFHLVLLRLRLQFIVLFHTAPIPTTLVPRTQSIYMVHPVTQKWAPSGILSSKIQDTCR